MLVDTIDLDDYSAKKKIQMGVRFTSWVLDRLEDFTTDWEEGQLDGDDLDSLLDLLVNNDLAKEWDRNDLFGTEGLKELIGG